jgi:hypothetical protein
MIQNVGSKHGLTANKLQLSKIMANYKSSFLTKYVSIDKAKQNYVYLEPTLSLNSYVKCVCMYKKI